MSPEPMSDEQRSDDPHEWLAALRDGKEWAWGPTAVCRRVGMLVAEVDRLSTELQRRDEPECDGMCVSSDDIGVPGYGIAYPHPGCPLHEPFDREYVEMLSADLDNVRGHLRAVIAERDELRAAAALPGDPPCDECADLDGEVACWHPALPGDPAEPEPNLIDRLEAVVSELEAGDEPGVAWTAAAIRRGIVAITTGQEVGSDDL